jgi:hypothetical protein
MGEVADTGVQSGLIEQGIGFPGGLSVDVREISDTNWALLTGFEYRAQTERFFVPHGERTDFASVPRVFVWFIPRYGRYTKAAVLHDHLCRLSEEGTFGRRDADGVFRQAMRVSGVPFLRRWIMWAAVRWGALGVRNGRHQWLRDLWRVLPITAVVLPIVLPAVVAIVAALTVWYVAEWITMGPLAVAKWAQTRRGTRPKIVNVPTLTFKT